ncbi:MAG: response regulator [Thermoplasmata archaeon]|nr:response regulator [Thermoplasmata archaeon]
MEEPTILLVEDEPNDVLLLERAFKKSDLRFPLRSVEDGEQCLAYLRGDPPYDDRDEHPFPAMVLLDLNLPRLSGLEVLETIRGDPALSHTPVVMLTASKLGEDVDRATELGANFYLVKPVRFEEYMDMAKAINLYAKVLKAKPRAAGPEGTHGASASEP